MKKILVLLVLAALPAWAGYHYWQRSEQPATSYLTAAVKRGDLLYTISATGTVEPVEVIDVGAQVAGKIQSFGIDPDGSGKPIDYGSAVEAGTVLARIDDSLYASDVQQAEAQVEQAKANVRRSEADLAQMKAKLQQAEHNWKRAQELGPSRALAATDYESFLAAYETAKATVAVGEATVVQAQKNVLQSQAALNRSRTNLGYCTIRSPVKGVIIDRRVNIGQTVVASLNAPSLFLIAKDLRKLQVWASVNEADIGTIFPGQTVTFTVDAFPGRTFRGEVGKVRLNATMTQNVVTYTVEINTDNADGRLLPYLTANLRFEVAQQKDVLMVPNSALRWKPSPAQIAPDARQDHADRQGRPSPSARGAGPPRDDRGGQAETRPARVRRTVWVRDGMYVRPIAVDAGLSDGTFTEVQGAGLTEGAEVVVGEQEHREGDNTASPFMPRLFGGGRRMG